METSNKLPSLQTWLITYLGNHFLLIAPKYLHEGQKFYVGGSHNNADRDKVWCVESNGREKQATIYTCNAEETDTRVWRHVHCTEKRQILIFSPDRCVSHWVNTVQFSVT